MNYSVISFYLKLYCEITVKQLGVNSISSSEEISVKSLQVGMHERVGILDTDVLLSAAYDY